MARDNAEYHSQNSLTQNPASASAETPLIRDSRKLDDKVEINIDDHVENLNKNSRGWLHKKFHNDYAEVATLLCFEFDLRVGIFINAAILLVDWMFQGAYLGTQVQIGNTSRRDKFEWLAFFFTFACMLACYAGAYRESITWIWIAIVTAVVLFGISIASVCFIFIDDETLAWYEILLQTLLFLLAVGTVFDCISYKNFLTGQAQKYFQKAEQV